MIKANNIRIIEYPNGHKIAELLEESAQAWNAKAAERRRAIFLKMYGFDAMDDKEAQEGLDKYFNGGE
jgi:hypothetical protein